MTHWISQRCLPAAPRTTEMDLPSLQFQPCSLNAGKTGRHFTLSCSKWPQPWPDDLYIETWPVIPWRCMAYLHRKNELSRSRHSKVRALTHADRQAYDQITTAGSRVVKITNIGPDICWGYLKKCCSGLFFDWECINVSLWSKGFNDTCWTLILLFPNSLWLSSNSTYSICCGFVVQLVVQQIHNKSNKWSLSFMPLNVYCRSAEYRRVKWKRFITTCSALALTTESHVFVNHENNKYTQHVDRI